MMDKEKILECYKVVRIDKNGDRISAWVDIHPYCMTYFPGVRVRALKGTLGCMAFRELNYARDFSRLCRPDRMEIWKCELTNPRSPGWILSWRNREKEIQEVLDALIGSDKRMALIDIVARETIDWAKERTKGEYDNVTVPFYGTVCGDALKLTERVE